MFNDLPRWAQARRDTLKIPKGLNHSSRCWPLVAVPSAYTGETSRKIKPIARWMGRSAMPRFGWHEVTDEGRLR